MTDPTPQSDTVSRLLDAVHPSFAMLAGMQLDLFTPLDAEPLTAEQLASEIGVQASKLRPLLYALVVAGLLTVEEDRFANTSDASDYLVRGKPGYRGGATDLYAANWTRMLSTAATIRAGGPPHETDYQTSNDELVDLFRGLYRGAVVDARRLMDGHDFSAASTLLDVGGGSGALAIAIAQANPHLKATVLDLPGVTPITQQFIDEVKAGDRVDVVAGDAVRDRPPGSYDVVVARHVVQVLSETDARALLNNLAAVLNPGGTIHVVGWILDDSRTAPALTVSYNLILLTNYQDGQAYTETEYFAWLRDAGFEEPARVALPDGSSIVTARRPAS